MNPAKSLADLARLVLEELDGFVRPAPHPGQLGAPLPSEWFATQLAEMRAALVEPYLVEVDGDGGRPERAAFQVAIVAEDDDVFLAYDPDPGGDFALIFKTAEGFGLSPLRGGAVDCFMAR